MSLVLVGLAASGCYAGVQNTSSIVRTDANSQSVGSESSMSVSNHALDFVAGLRYRKFEFFAGYGVGSTRASSQTSMTVQSSENDSSRASMGISLSLLQFNYFLDVGIFGILSGSDFIVSSDAKDENSVENSYEAGIQFKVMMPPKGLSGFNVEPFLRLGIASESGRVKTGLYSNDEGLPEFSGTAIMATLGVNMGFSVGQR